ncbi:hypothetical protein AMS68_006412 [Peltaster fructicola]|uniref:Mob1/phocein n=1 Tax=Peltaster fructicola TaxID=286661 RepID=A0A6H0Y1U9_9PEZI|nr:hypothetical protein AMS68_006412 [Peltaster fructicola]
MASALSPASSPRLPSPPPIAEDQIGPTSPGLSSLEDHGKMLPGETDTNAARRIRPGTRAEDMAEGPPLVELQDIDSAFQLTEHLKALYYSQTHPEGHHSTTPISASLAKQLATPPANTTKEIWLYELGRFLIQKTNSIIVGLFADDPPCSPQTCPEMRASEWQYLCAVHDPPKSCSAIDYCCHTLDWAASTLTSSKMFPSRLGLGSTTTGAANSDKVLQQQMKELTNIFRRVYRIYAHAWFQHREMFWRIESKTGLYLLFKTVCDNYGLIQPENYTIPAEAEGSEPDDPNEELDKLPEQSLAVPSVLKRHEGEDNALGKLDTTKKHPRHNYSNSTSVTNVIQEEAEEEEEASKPALDRQTTAIKPSEEAEMVESPASSTSVINDSTKAPESANEADEGEITVLAADILDVEETPSALPSSNPAS